MGPVNSPRKIVYNFMRDNKLKHPFADGYRLPRIASPTIHRLVKLSKVDPVKFNAWCELINAVLEIAKRKYGIQGRLDFKLSYVLHLPSFKFLRDFDIQSFLSSRYKVDKTAEKLFLVGFDPELKLDLSLLEVLNLEKWNPNPHSILFAD